MGQAVALQFGPFLGPFNTMRVTATPNLKVYLSALGSASGLTEVGKRIVCIWQCLFSLIEQSNSKLIFLSVRIVLSNPTGTQ